VNEPAIFLYGVVVFAIVATACALIVFGIVEERRDRQAHDKLTEEAVARQEAGRAESETKSRGIRR
jgi:hypothetical protein